MNYGHYYAHVGMGIVWFLGTSSLAYATTFKNVVHAKRPKGNIIIAE